MPHVVNFNNSLYSLPEDILSLDNDKIFDYINNFSIWRGREIMKVFQSKGSTLKYTTILQRTT